MSYTEAQLIDARRYLDKISSDDYSTIEVWEKNSYNYMLSLGYNNNEILQLDNARVANAPPSTISDVDFWRQDVIEREIMEQQVYDEALFTPDDLVDDAPVWQKNWINEKYLKYNGNYNLMDDEELKIFNNIIEMGNLPDYTGVVSGIETEQRNISGMDAQDYLNYAYPNSNYGVYNGVEYTKGYNGQWIVIQNIGYQETPQSLGVDTESIINAVKAEGNRIIERVNQLLSQGIKYDDTEIMRIINNFVNSYDYEDVSEMVERLGRAVDYMEDVGLGERVEALNIMKEDIIYPINEAKQELRDLHNEINLKHELLVEILSGDVFSGSNIEKLSATLDYWSENTLMSKLKSWTSDLVENYMAPVDSEMFGNYLNEMNKLQNIFQTGLASLLIGGVAFSPAVKEAWDGLETGLSSFNAQLTSFRSMLNLLNTTTRSSNIGAYSNASSLWEYSLTQLPGFIKSRYGDYYVRKKLY